MSGFEVLTSDQGAPIKMWTKGVPVEPEARQQLLNTAQMPFIYRHLAVMPDVHLGKGSTIGSVIPTKGAIIPAAVGVDLGCGMTAARTSLTAADLPVDLRRIRLAIEKAVPHGRTVGRGKRDVGSWHHPPESVNRAWARLRPGFEAITRKYPRLKNTNNHNHLGTLGTGNHFVELCLDEEDRVWVMLHSGSRGVGNAIATTFIRLAGEEMKRKGIRLPDPDLAYLQEGTRLFDDYVEAVAWAQEYARVNRQLMLEHTLAALAGELDVEFTLTQEPVDCHHNYVQREQHFGQEVWVTRKGAVSAQAGQLGIIPGSMGAKSYIVRGLGNSQSFHSCSHGAGRIMSRTQAKKAFTLEEHRQATAHVECRKDAAVLDETPGAYKDIEAVMAAQKDLRQIVCVKG